MIAEAFCFLLDFVWCGDYWVVFLGDWNISIIYHPPQEVFTSSTSSCCNLLYPTRVNNNVRSTAL